MSQFNAIISAVVAAPLFCGAAYAASDLHMEEIGGTDHAPVYEETGGLPQLDPSSYSSQLFWLAIIFFALYFVFSKKVLPDLGATIMGRRDHIRNDLETADDLREAADAAKEAYEAVLEEARQRASGNYAEIEVMIRDKNTSEMKAFSERVIRESQVAEVRINKVKREIMLEIDDVTVDIATKAVEKITGQKIKTDIAQNIIDDYHKNSKAA